MFSIHFAAFTLLFGCLLIGNLRAEDKAPPEEDFALVAEILTRHCLGCHGPKTQEGSYSVETIDKLFKPGDSEIQPIVPGDAQGSELYRRLISTDVNLRMPLDAPALPEEDRKRIQTWLDHGAKKPSPSSSSITNFVRRKTTTLSATKVYPHLYPISSVALSADGSRLFSAGYGEVLVWSTEDGTLHERIGELPRFITDIEVSSDDQWLVVAGGKPGLEGTVSVINFKDRTSIRPLVQLSDTPTDMALAPDSSKLAVGDSLGNVRIYAMETSLLISQWTPHADAILAIEWSDDGKQLSTASRDRTGKLFDASSHALVASYSRHERAVGGITLTSLGPVTYDDTGVVHLWNPERDEQRAERSGLPRILQRLTHWNSEVFVADQGMLHRFHLESRESDQGKDDKGNAKKKTSWKINPMPPLELNHAQWITAITSPKSGRIAVGTEQGRGAVWDLTTGKLLNSFSLQPQ